MAQAQLLSFGPNCLHQMVQCSAPGGRWYGKRFRSRSTSRLPTGRLGSVTDDLLVYSFILSSICLFIHICLVYIYDIYIYVYMYVYFTHIYIWPLKESSRAPFTGFCR